MSDEPTVDGSTDDTTTPEPAAPVEEKPKPVEGSVVVTLVTEVGEADITVPPMNTWRSSARSALNSRGDDLTWAAITLSEDDFKAWKDLDPTNDETEKFFEEVGRKLGVNNRSDRRAQRRNLRAVG